MIAEYVGMGKDKSRRNIKHGYVLPCRSTDHQSFKGVEGQILLVERDAFPLFDVYPPTEST